MPPGKALTGEAEAGRRVAERDYSVVRGVDIRRAARIGGAGTNGGRHEGAEEMFDRAIESPEAHAAGPPDWRRPPVAGRLRAC